MTLPGARLLELADLQKQLKPKKAAVATLLACSTNDGASRQHIHILQVICSGGSWQFFYIYCVCSTHTLQASQVLGTCCEAPLQR